MAGMERKRRAHNESFALDMMHIIVGITVVILAVLSFLNPEDHMILFPVIFFLAAALNLVTGNYRLRREKRDGKRKAAAAMQMIFGLALALLGIVSAVSIWWRWV